jgi:hypothetical protein
MKLLVFKPWLKKHAKGEDQKHEDHKWKVIEPHERGRVPKIEALVWLTIADADSDVEGIRRDVVNGRLNSIRSKCIYHPDFARD